MEDTMSSHHFFAGILKWIGNNKEWLFSRIGVAVIAAVISRIYHHILRFIQWKRPQQKLKSNLPKENKNFTGRASYLKRLHRCLQKGDNQGMTSISGLGGIGKTGLALAYAHHPKYNRCYPQGIIWVNAAQGIEA
jgi:hypothetical protein